MLHLDPVELEGAYPAPPLVEARGCLSDRVRTLLVAGAALVVAGAGSIVLLQAGHSARETANPCASPPPNTVCVFVTTGGP
ncbi:hypothetical protein ABZ721_37080 [Streptomyces sp. NPDC006733]|uniref:hypothetical protein n=1 Tax=Streptomyces sp. NPDC006733 TaxID=3155460 RepID=UPI0033CD46E0